MNVRGEDDQSSCVPMKEIELEPKVNGLMRA